MKKVFKILIYFLVAPQLLFSQIWVANYQFGQPGLDPDKWSAWNQWTTSFDSSSMNISNKIPYGGSYNIVASSGYDLKQNLPLNHSWSVVQRFMLNETENPNYYLSMKASYASSSIENFVDQLSGIIYLYPPFPTPPTPTINFNVEMPLNTFVWYGLSYDYDMRTLFRVYSFSSETETPSIESFQKIGDEVSSVGSENVDVKISNTVVFLANGSIKTTSYNIVPYSVPEPSALSLLAVGLGGMAMLRRRRS